LTSRIDAGTGDRQQFRSPRSRRDVEGDEGSVPVRGQAGEDLVELFVGDCSGEAGWDPWSVKTDSFVANRLHRVVVRVGPSAPTRAIERERVEQRATSCVTVKVVEAAQDGLAVRTDGGRVLAGGLEGPSGLFTRSVVAPVRSEWFWCHLQQDRKLARARAIRPVPVDFGGPAKAEPAQQIHPIRAQRRRRTARGQQVSKEGRHGFDYHPVGSDEAVGVEGVFGRLEPPDPTHDHRGQGSTGVHLLAH
jgi:hypothetical protein